MGKKKSSRRDQQTIRFLRWIERYPGWWQLICMPKDEHINLPTMKTLIKRLAEESFYEIIFVLLMVHREEPFMESFYQSMLVNMVAYEWKTGRKDEFIARLLDYFE